jgi:RNA polymerase sigma-32 factor
VTTAHSATTRSSRYPRLSHERETQLVVAWQRDRSQGAARELFLAQQRHVIALARKYTRYGPGTEELIAEGNAGLARALEKFDVHRETRFVTYAAYWIRAYMMNYALRTWSMVRDRSGGLNSRYFYRLRRERAKLVAQGENFDAEKLAGRLGVSRSQVVAMLQSVDRRDLSLDAQVDGTTPLQDRLRADAVDAEQEVIGGERRKLASTLVRHALTWLDDRERRIVCERLMRSREDRPSLAALGAELGVTRERVRQLEERAMRKIREGIQRSCDKGNLDWLAFD